MTAASVAMSTAGSLSGVKAGGLDGRQVALHVDHDVQAVFGIERLQRFENPVGAGDVIAAGHHRAAAGLFNRRRHRFGIGRYHRFADVSCLCTP